MKLLPKESIYHIMNNSKLYYTGIGSRETPTNILALMSDISIKLEKKGLLRRLFGREEIAT